LTTHNSTQTHHVELDDGHTAFAHVLRHSPYIGAKHLVLLTVATVNDTYGDEFSMTTADLAHLARVSRPAATRALTQFVEDGWLIRSYSGKLDGRASRYRFVFDSNRPVVYETDER
jgi:DNA-binding MarR family transcriptional regulator